MYQPSRRTTQPPAATLRTFRAADTASALAAVKAALGPEAVIIDTRSVEVGMFRRPEVEVTASLGQPETALADALAGAASAFQSAPPPALPPAGATATGRSAPGLRPARGFCADDALLDDLPAGPGGEEEMEDALRRSFDEARRALSLVAKQARAARKPRLPAAAQGVLSRLTACGVDPALAEELVAAALASGASRKGALLARVRAEMEARLPVTGAPWLTPGRQVIAYVGPTGVGKTTTLAKVAARALLESRKRLALITVDTYRIGAADQLARYGEIMGAPVLVARDRTELARAMERVGQADMVLVDTAGRSSAEDVERQAALVRTVAGLQLHLVVSAAAGSQQLAAVGERYRAIAPEGLVLSKMDEAAGPGGILSLAARIDRPIACVADGQRVPEDLHAFDSARIVDLVFAATEASRS